MFLKYIHLTSCYYRGMCEQALRMRVTGRKRDIVGPENTEHH